MRELTRRQSEVLHWLDEREQAGYPPTIREIGRHFGISSTNGVSDHLRALQFKGFITRSEILARSVRLTDKARAWLGRVDPRTAALREALDKLNGLGEAGFREWLEDECESQRAKRSA